MRRSKLTYTKNVIFTNRAKSEPKVYWELIHFAKALNYGGKYWENQHWRHFPNLQAEFEFHPLTLLPNRRSLGQKPGIIAKKDCPQETLLATNGLLAILLHWATQVQMCRERQDEAKAMLKDILRRLSPTLYEEVADSLIDLFSKRKKSQRLWTDCVNGMHRVELCMNAKILAEMHSGAAQETILPKT